MENVIIVNIKYLVLVDAAFGIVNMRISLLLRTLSIGLLIAIIAFFRYSDALAQQASDSVLAVLDAQRDAKADVNDTLWTVVGLISASSCTMTGIATGIYIGIPPTSQYHDDAGAFIPVDKVIEGGCIGSIVGWSVPLIPISTYKLKPSPQRLIGKSPEYVNRYTETYMSKVRQLRILSAAKGACAGCFLVTMFVNIGIK